MECNSLEINELRAAVWHGSPRHKRLGGWGGVRDAPDCIASAASLSLCPIHPVGRRHGLTREKTNSISRAICAQRWSYLADSSGVLSATLGSS